MRQRQALGLFEVDAPVAAADDIDPKRLTGEWGLGFVGFQVRPQRHVGREEPRRRAEHHQVVVTLLGLVGNPDLAGLAAQLRQEQRQDAEHRVAERKHREVLGIVRVGELDAGTRHVVAALLQCRGDRVTHSLGLLGVAVVDDQYSWLGIHSGSDPGVGLTGQTSCRATRNGSPKRRITRVNRMPRREISAAPASTGVPPP